MTCHCSYRAPKSIVGIVATAVLLLGVSRTTMLFVLTYELPRSCEMNSTQMNSSDCAKIAAESEHKSRYYQVTDLLYIFYSFLNWVEYAILAHGLYNLLTKTSNAMVKPGEEAAFPNPALRADLRDAYLNQRPSLHPRADLKKLFIKVRENKGKHYKVWLGAPLVAVFVTIYILASLATPVVGIHCQRVLSRLQRTTHHPDFSLDLSVPNHCSPHSQCYHPGCNDTCSVRSQSYLV